MRKKRGQGEGSIFWRADRERWVAAVSLPDGRRREKQCRTKREAQEWLTAALGTLQGGGILAAPKMRMDSFLLEWLENTAQVRLRPSAFREYEFVVKKRLIPALGNLRLAELTPRRIQRFYSSCLEEGLAARTVRKYHAVLHAALRDAVLQELLPANPADRVTAPRVPRRELRVLNEEEVVRLLQAAREDPLEALYVLAVTTGMRQGELLALKWENVRGNEIAVERTLSRAARGHSYQFSEPKTAAGRRRIALGPLAVLALNRHRERQAALRAFAGEDWEEHGLVFTNRKGRRLHPSHVSRYLFLPLLERAGLPRIRFHDLRHTAATLLLQGGTHPKVVQELLGHSAIAITMDVYSHVLPGLQEQAIASLNARLLSCGLGAPVAGSVAGLGQKEAAGGA